MRTLDEPHGNPILGAVAGAAGGLAASWTMVQFNKALGGTDGTRRIFFLEISSKEENGDHGEDEQHGGMGHTEDLLLEISDEEHS